MKHSILNISILAAVLFLFADNTTIAAEKKAPENAQFKLALDGILESRNMLEVPVKTEEWVNLKVLKSASHGQQVSKGDMLLVLDTEELDKAIEATRKQVDLSILSLEEAEIDLQKAKASYKIELASAKRKNKITQEDLQIFLKQGLARAKEAALHSVKMAEEFLSYQIEELKQLEKMYKADELTEETEEIVLKRQRNQVENSRYSLKRAQRNMEKTLKIDLPRQIVSKKIEAKLAELALKQALAKLPVQMKTSQITFEQKKTAHNKLTQKLKSLLDDRKSMIIKAPGSGIVYYGKCTRGVWSDSTQISPMLQPGGTVKPGMVVMTIVKSRPLVIRSIVKEADLRHIKEGMKGRANTISFPDTTFTVIISKVDSIPLKPGSFGATFTTALPGKAEAIVPGMQCKISIGPKKKSQKSK